MRIFGLKLYQKILFPLCVGFFILSAGHVFGYRGSNGSYSPIRVTIQMKETVFKIGEPVEGTVVLENTYPANLPATFNIKLFHEGKPVSDLLTAIERVPSGTTPFSFKAFGVPFFNKGVASEGTWRLSIVQQNLDESYSKEITIQIVRENAPVNAESSDTKKNGYRY